MRIADFALERYFARWEFAVEYLLCASDVEGYPMAELLALADAEARGLWENLRLGYTESTGHPLLRAEIASLYEGIAADDILVFAGAEEADRMMAGADAFERGISLGVMSKSFAMAGLRIGWLACHDRELLARCAAFKDHTTICASAPAEILALIGLRARDEVLARSRRIVADNLAPLDAFFVRRSDRLSWVRPRGGSIAFPRLVDDVPVDRFAAELVETSGVLLLPGSQFGHPGNHFRIGFGRQNLP